MGTPTARWVILATVLGSGVAFLDGTIVNVALPAIAEDLDASLSDMQWVLDAYLVTLTALLLLGGSLGDRVGRRRMFLVGLVGFTVASIACGVAPNVGVLVVARGLQGVGAALLVPGSLAIIAAVFAEEDRGRAVGAWSGLAGVSTAIGPFIGGWLIDAVSWRVAFLLNVPLAAAVVYAARHVPETRDEEIDGPIDWAGAATASIGLALATYGLIEQLPLVTVAGLLALVAFVLVERRAASPMMPLSLFRSAQFSGTNLTTIAVYGALGGAFFLFVVQLQVSFGYSALEAGSALLPVTILMLVLSSRAGALAQQIGPRIPMSVGPLIVAAGLVYMAQADAGSDYLTSVFPAAVVFGLGLSLTVAPLTATVMASAAGQHMGVASAVNNAAARLAGLLAIAVLPAAVGIETATVTAAELDAGADRAMLAAAGLAALGGLIAFATVRTARAVATPAAPIVAQPCLHPCVEKEAEAEPDAA